MLQAVNQVAGLKKNLGIPVIGSREAAVAPAPADLPRSHFLRRSGAWRLIVLIVIYKAGEAFAGGMLRPFLVDAHLTITDVGWLLGTVGFVAGMLGAIVLGVIGQRGPGSLVSGPPV
jgi:hypothetical protein